MRALAFSVHVLTACGAALALLVQLSFLVLVTPPHHVRPEVEKETLLLLPPTRPEADAGYVIMEQVEYPPMSGTNTICVGTEKPAPLGEKIGYGTFVPVIGDFSSLAPSVITKARAVAASRARTTAVDRTRATSHESTEERRGPADLTGEPRRGRS